MRITHLRHSCLLVEVAGVRLLIDPGTFSEGFTELRDLDAVLVTHQHLDHLDAERLPAVLASNDAAQLITESQTAAQLAQRDLPAAPLSVGVPITIGPVTITGVGGRHAVIHEEIPRVGNVGLVISAPGEPTLFHPGDMIDTVPPDVDVLALPIAAPWSAVKETVEFLRAVRPARAFPIHEAILAGPGLAVYSRVIGSLLPEGTTMVQIPTLEPFTV